LDLLPADCGSLQNDRQARTVNSSSASPLPQSPKIAVKAMRGLAGRAAVLDGRKNPQSASQTRSPLTSAFPYAAERFPPVHLVAFCLFARHIPGNMYSSSVNSGMRCVSLLEMKSPNQIGGLHSFSLSERRMLPPSFLPNANHFSLMPWGYPGPRSVGFGSGWCERWAVSPFLCAHFQPSSSVRT